jgi:exosortase
MSVFFFLAFLWLPICLVKEANPDWRMISWMLALEAIGLTLAVFWLTMGRDSAALFVFPLCFFLVAVPWPAHVEGPVIQALTRVCTSASVEVVSWLSIPAMQHGNLIEVATGTVGVDEACSGIRSFQSTLMISFFLGEFYGLLLWRRIVLVPVGFLLALLFNVVRISFLTSVAAHEGVPAIAKYHDPAGLTIMVACVFSLWLLALLFKKSGQAPTPATAKFSQNLNPPRAMKRLAFGLFVWLVTVEVGVELWYKAHEWHLPPSTAWSVDWPRSNPTFSEVPIAERAKWLLRYDEEVSATWQEGDGARWSMLYLRWLPGRVAAHLARMHTPEVCISHSRVKDAVSQIYSARWRRAFIRLLLSLGR